MKRYFKIAYFYLKLRLVTRFRKRFLIKVLRREGSRLSSDLAKSGLTVTSWIQETRNNPSLYINPADGTLEALKNRAPQLADATIAAADRVLNHEFDLLGSGPFIPVDPDRRALTNGYRPIDWTLDPVSGLRFPQVTLHPGCRISVPNSDSQRIFLPVTELVLA